MKSSGVLVDCSELKAQLSRLIESTRYRTSDTNGKLQSLKIDPKTPTVLKVGQDPQSDKRGTTEPRILHNARGIAYVEGDPNLGYTEEENYPFPPKHNQVSACPQGKTRNWASLFAV
ncbi:hypothetical protein RHGRI_017223 [Rhododendron griersonianum]|uniref:Late embryogenesis abundant protein n=1 Tax=Rhododendron griersonianum TaxID=479676 RepID=A0AAV6JX03_9ERIC|nr:hypothetical protein RHGRI_017223 [Rhododendron griersonianum]